MLFCAASKAQNESSSANSVEVMCGKEHPDRCSALIKPGEPAPFYGVIMTMPMAIALQTTLDGSIARLEEEQAFCDEQLRIQDSSRDNALKTLKESSDKSEARLKKALAEEQERGRQSAQETSEEETGQVLWAAGGVAAGLVVGLVVGGAVALYLVATIP